jgi:hypothetical protein
MPKPEDDDFKLIPFNNDIFPKRHIEREYKRREHRPFK